MKYIDEFRNQGLIKRLSEKIRAINPGGDIRIMEVCGTHTQNFFRFGVDRLLPENIRLICGPGCPVCVSTQGYIDQAIALSGGKDKIILSFGDMLRVPGRHSTLEKERAMGGDVRVVYSPLDSLKIAEDNPDKKIVFLAVGFETTAPAVALSIIRAKKNRLKNLFFYSALKLIPPAMEFILRDKRTGLKGFLCPGHVSCIIGARAYDFIPARHKIGCCVTGFEPLDILEGIYFILRQIISQRPGVDNQYSRAVTRQGNLKAQKIISRVFSVCDAEWRGLGRIKKSGLRINRAFSRFDAQREFSLNSTGKKDHALKCRCADVLKGLILPVGCRLFAKACRPEKPLGPCMVSSEGACNAYYKYRRRA